MKSVLEKSLAIQLVACKLPKFEREFKFHPTRKWRFDFAWPESKVAVECEGAVWTNGRHTRGSGFVKDMEKYNEAALLGWRVLRFDAGQIKSGNALQAIERMLTKGDLSETN